MYLLIILILVIIYYFTRIIEGNRGILKNARQQQINRKTLQQIMREQIKKIREQIRKLNQAEEKKRQEKLRKEREQQERNQLGIVISYEKINL